MSGLAVIVVPLWAPAGPVARRPPSGISLSGGAASVSTRDRPVAPAAALLRPGGTRHARRASTSRYHSGGEKDSDSPEGDDGGSGAGSGGHQGALGADR